MTRIQGWIMQRSARLCCAYFVMLSGMATFGAAASLQAQDTGGMLIGRLESADGSVLPGVMVTVRGPSLIGARTAATDPTGSFRFTSLPGGTYTVEVDLIGYRTVVFEDVRIVLGGATALGGRVTTLEAAPVGLDPLVVTAARPLIDVTTPAVMTSLGAETFMDLPTERDYRDLIKLVPQANESLLGDPVNVAGATGLENLTYIDGLNVTDPFFGSLGTKLPYNFVKEFQVRTGGYEAEYGGAMGGIVNVVTRSGGDSWSLSGIGYFNNASLTSDASLGAADLVSRGADAYDVGVDVGGPLVRDRLWLFAAYNPFFSKTEVEIPGLGFFRDERTEHLFAAKLDWRAGANTDIVLSAFGDPTTWDRVGGGPFTLPDTLLAPGPFLNRYEDGGINIILEGTHRAGSRGVLDFGLGYSYRDFFDGPRPGDDEARFVHVPTGAFEGGFGEYISYEGRRFSARIAGTLFLASHTLKGGFEYEDSGLDPYRTGNSGHGVILDFGSTADEQCLVASFGCRYWTIFLDDVGGATVKGRVPTLFAQDSWEIVPELRFNYGIRWTGEYLIDSNGDVGQSITDEWQPRLAFVLQPGEPGAQKLTGSWGRFYQRMPLRLVSNFYNGVPQNGIAAWRGDPRTDGVLVDTLAVFCCAIQPEHEMSGSYVDEVTLGYERSLGPDMRIGVRGVARTLGDVVTIGTEATRNSNEIGSIVGNPGSDSLDFLEKAERRYRALELTFDWSIGDNGRLSASYVLSRNRGNFPGLYDSDSRLLFPNQASIFERPYQMPRNYGPLPNDRTHALKVWGSFRFGFGLNVGTYFTAQSGTPLSRYETVDIAFRQAFLSQRGSEGRTPSIWDLSTRLSYPVALGPAGGWKMNLTADFLHIGNPQKTVLFDQTQTLEGGIRNPTFEKALAFQDPFTVRLGLAVGF